MNVWKLFEVEFIWVGCSGYFIPCNGWITRNILWITFFCGCTKKCTSLSRVFSKNLLNWENFLFFPLSIGIYMENLPKIATKSTWQMAIFMLRWLWIDGSTCRNDRLALLSPRKKYILALCWRSNLWNILDSFATIARMEGIFISIFSATVGVVPLRDVLYKWACFLGIGIHTFCHNS